MIKSLDNFIKKLKKLDDYFILREENEYFILATTITIKEHIELHNMFSTYTTNKDKNLGIFFILKLDQHWAATEEYEKRKIPILTINKHIATAKIDEIKKIIDRFVTSNFKTI